MSSYKLAHVGWKGVELIIIPLDSSFGAKSLPEKERAITQFQNYASAARLKGTVALVWSPTPGKTSYVAPKSVLQSLKDINFALVKTNKELIVNNNVVSTQPIPKQAQAPLLPGLGGDDRARGLSGSNTSTLPAPSSGSSGILSVTADTEQCQVFVDGTLVGEAPIKAEVAAGSRKIEVKKTGYRDYRIVVQIAEGTELPLRIPMERDDTISIPLSETKLQTALDQRGKVTEFQKKHRGLVTLLFTDLVGSTKLKQDLGDQQAIELMQKHHRLVREILRTFPDGEEISTAGDSFFLVFDKPSDAVKFSLMLQATLREAFEDSPQPIKDRIGIHVGEVVYEHSGAGGKMKDLYGIQVDTCARVMSLGEGDQILMTRFAYDTARQVLRGDKIEGVSELSWMTHGYYNMKGVEDEIEICEVGETDQAVLRAPGNSEKASRAGANAPSTPSGPQIVGSSGTVTKVQPIKVFRSS